MLLACGEDPVEVEPELEEVRVMGTVRLDGTPRAVSVYLYHLGGPTPAQRLAETTSGADGTYDVSAEVHPLRCDAFYVAADFRPVGGDFETSLVLAGCGDHTADIDG